MAGEASSHTAPTAVIRGRVVLEGVGSASAVEVAGSVAYVIGDDAAYLYTLSTADWSVVSKTALFTPSEGTPTEHIPKKVKPDLELMTPLPPAGDGAARLACLGSGSKVGVRDRVFVVTLASPGTVSHVVERSASRVYDVLRASPSVVGPNKLNLEAAATVEGGTHLLLFHRGNISGVNTVIGTPVAEFESALAASGAGVPSMRVACLALPDLSGYHAGTSGAAAVTLPAACSGVGGGVPALLLSASYEATTNEIDDGDTLGSLVGLVAVAPLLAALAAGVRIDDVAAGTTTGSPPVVHPVTALIQGVDGTPFTGKVEGVAPVAIVVEGDAYVITAVAVTDSDGGASELLTLEFRVPMAAL